MVKLPEIESIGILSVINEEYRIVFHCSIDLNIYNNLKLLKFFRTVVLYSCWIYCFFLSFHINH